MLLVGMLPLSLLVQTGKHGVHFTMKRHRLSSCLLFVIRIIVLDAQQKGDIFTFVQQFEGVDFLGALKILADRAGVDLGSYTSKTRDEMSRLYEIMERATLFIKKNSPSIQKQVRILRHEVLQKKRFDCFVSGMRQMNGGSYIYDAFSSRIF